MKTRLPRSKTDFVANANIIHKNKYNYNATRYINSRTRIKVECTNHGIFEILPSAHLQGYGCKICNKEKRLKNKFKYFLKAANKIHDTRYSYDASSFVGMTKPLKIYCHDHGWFEQLPTNHINQKQGCPACVGRGKSTSDFIIQAQSVHGKRYDYSQTKYLKAKEKVTIICYTHGKFEQTPNEHLNGCGCPKCRPNARLSHEQFISRAIAVHGKKPKYDYSLVEYTNRITPVTIICPTHGKFEQRPEAHFKGSGCPKCRMSKGESKIFGELQGMKVKFEYQKSFNDCVSDKGRVLCFDFYIPEQNLLIEYDGEQHFGNTPPKSWNFNWKRIQQLDEIKNKWAKKNNIKLVRIPYWEYKNISAIIKEQI